MKDKVLIVDDNEINRAVLAGMLRDEYQILEAENGKAALPLMEENIDELAIVLLDLMMPELDGFGVLEVMNQNDWMKKLPVLVITGEDDAGTEERCFEEGVSDFITKPFSHVLVKLRVSNIVKLFQYRLELEEMKSKADDMFLES